MQLDGYELQKWIGEGGSGKVYRAIQLATGATVAVKMLASFSRDALDRFRREAVILYSQANNRFIVDLIGYNFESQPPFIVLEYCKGGNIRPWTERLRPWRDVAFALSYVVNGLTGIHRLGGFHRDIKPENLLLTIDNEKNEWIVKLSDFGLARVPTSDTTMTGSPCGTPGYMAPELAYQPYSTASDVYSLGVVALELLTASKDPAGLSAANCPHSLRDLAKSMIDVRPSRRPTVPQIAGKLYEIIVQGDLPPARARLRIADTKKTVSLGDTLGKLALGGLAVLLLKMLAEGDTKEWDKKVQRFRGSDGRFVSG